MPDLRINLKLKLVGLENLDKIEKKVKDFTSKKITLFGGGQGNDSVKKLGDGLSKAFTELDRSIDAMPKKVDAFFNNIFVGADNLFSIGRKLRLRVGTFIGNSRATMITIVNDVVKLMRTMLPGLVQAAKVVDKIEKNASKMLSGEGSQRLQSIFGKNKPPLLLDVRVFMEQARQFLDTGIKEIKTVTNLVKFIFGVTKQEMTALDAKVTTEHKKVSSKILGLKDTVAEVFSFTEKKMSLLGNLARGLFKVLVLPITLPLKLLSATFNKLKTLAVGRKKTPQKVETTQDEKVAQLQNLRVKRSQKLIDLEREFAKNLVTNETTIRDWQRQAINLQSGILNKLADAINKLEKSMKTAFNRSEIKAFVDEIARLKRELESLSLSAGKKSGSKGLSQGVGSFFEFDTLKAKMNDKTGRGAKGALSSNQSTFFKSFITSAFDVSQAREFSQEHFDKVFATMMKSMGISAGKVKVPIDAVRKTSKLMFETGKLAVNEGFKGKDLGQVFGKALTASLKGKTSPGLKAAIKKSMSSLNETVRKSGGEVDKQLAEGMKANKKVVGKAIEGIAKEAMDYLPQSPAKLGPLKRLPFSGQQIPLQIATGMLQRAASVTKAAEIIAGMALAPFRLAIQKIKDLYNEFKTSLGDVNKVGDLSALTGISPENLGLLSNLYAEVGESVTSYSTAIARMNTNLSKDKQFEKLGVDLASIRNSANPAKEALLAVSDVLATSAQGSEEYRLAIELLGLTAQDKLIGVLRRGREEIEKLTQGSNFFNAINQTVVEAAAKLRAVQTRLKEISSAIKNDFFGEIFPNMAQLLEKVEHFLENHAVSIRNFIIRAGALIGGLISIMVGFVKYASREPEKAFMLIVNAAKITADTIGTIIDDITNQIEQNLTTGLVVRIEATIEGLLKAVVIMLNVLVEQFDLRVAKLLLNIEKFFLNVEGLWSSMGGKFLTYAGEVVGRWALFWINGLNEIWISIQNFFLDLRDYYRIQILEMKKFILENLQDIPIFGTAKKDIEEVNKQIVDLAKDVDKRNEAGFFERLEKSNRDLIDSLPTTQEALEEIDKKLAESNKKAFSDITTGFKEAYSSVLELKELGSEATEGVFSEDALERYNQKLQEGKDKIINLVSGTELEEPVFEFVDRVFGRANEKIDELKDKIAGIDPSQGKGNELKEGFFTSMFGDPEKMKEGANKISGIFNNLYESTGKQIKAFFFAHKAFALSEAIINMHRGIMQAIGAKGILGVIEGAAITAESLSNIAQISSQTIQGFAFGGYVNQGTGPRSDDVMAKLSRGEFVIPANIVNDFGVGFFESMRAGLLTPKNINMDHVSVPSTSYTPRAPRYADGGSVNPSSSGGSEIVIVNSIDNSVFDKHLASARGRRVIKNVIGSESKEINRILTNG